LGASIEVTPWFNLVHVLNSRNTAMSQDRRGRPRQENTVIKAPKKKGRCRPHGQARFTGINWAA